MQKNRREHLRKIANLIRKEIGADNTDGFVNLIRSIVSEPLRPASLYSKEYRAVVSLPESPGWLYQYYLEPELEIFRSQSAPKIKDHQIAMRTHQCTPRWIADFLTQNSIGKIWLQMHPESKLKGRMKYLIPSDELLPVKRASQIKILDPACGAMHLGLAAYDVLEMMYREELDNAGRAGWPEKPSVKNNIFGIDLDPIAIALAKIALNLRSGGKLRGKFNLFQSDSLKQNLRGRIAKNGFPDKFDVVLLNPPYLDKRDYNLSVKSYMAKSYPISGRNFYTAFVEQSIKLLTDNGRLAAVTPQTFMFIRTFEKFRKFVLEHTVVESLVHTGLNTFSDAIVDCAFYVLRREDNGEVRKSHKSQFFQLTGKKSPSDKNQHLLRLAGNPVKKYLLSTKEFSALPGGPWVYWITGNIRRLFADMQPLGSVAELRQGLATTDNKRFLRYWWEIPASQIEWNCKSLPDAKKSGRKWFPYMKGGDHRKWYGNREILVNWKNDGQEIKDEIVRRYPYLKGNWQWVAKNSEFYFREGITYSYLTSGQFSARYSPPGAIFDVAGSSIFYDDLYALLGILNSRWTRFALSLLNHTVNFQVGDLKRLPLPELNNAEELRKLVRKAIRLSKKLDSFDETSPDFLSPPMWCGGVQKVRNIHRMLEAIQDDIDRTVYALYGLNTSTQKLINQQTEPHEKHKKITRDELAYRWVSYAIGLSFRDGNEWRCSLSDLGEKVAEILIGIHGKKETQKIVRTLNPTGSLWDYLSHDFFEKHFQIYRGRPIYWLIKEKGVLDVFYYHNMTNKAMEQVQGGRKGKYSFDFDDGIAHNIRLFIPVLALPSWRRKLQ